MKVKKQKNTMNRHHLITALDILERAIVARTGAEDVAAQASAAMDRAAEDVRNAKALASIPGEDDVADHLAALAAIALLEHVADVAQRAVVVSAMARIDVLAARTAVLCAVPIKP